jgi:large subunit ribosomal protein L18
MRTEKKQELEQRRRWRVRQRVMGTAARPRMSVRFTGQHVYVQFVDDQKRVTLAATSSRAKGLPEGGRWKANVEGAKRLGTIAADVAKSRGISQVVFDRSGARYHGKVKALADAAREGGLQF